MSEWERLDEEREFRYELLAKLERIATVLERAHPEPVKLTPEQRAEWARACRIMFGHLHDEVDEQKPPKQGPYR
jgi:hypothetical protein